MSSIICQVPIDQIKDARNGFAKSKLLGRGGEGKVYLTKVCIERKWNWVAVKHLYPNSNGLEKEIQTFPKIQHPHIVHLLGYSNQSGQNMLVYEYMKNGSLSDYFGKETRMCLSWPQRVKIILGAAKGLRHLHTPTKEFPKGIIHRDVKPANILLDENFVAKVSDFGMSMLSHSGQVKSTMATDLKGTPGFYAPEYIKSGKVTRKIDIYAFGLVLFQLLCRKTLWDSGGESYYPNADEDLGLSAQENVDKEIKREISIDSLKAFADIIGRCLKTDPAARPTMDDVVLDLEKVLQLEDPTTWDGLVVDLDESPTIDDVVLQSEDHSIWDGLVVNTDEKPEYDERLSKNTVVVLDLNEVPKYQEPYMDGSLLNVDKLQSNEVNQPLHVSSRLLSTRHSNRESKENEIPTVPKIQQPNMKIESVFDFVVVKISLSTIWQEIRRILIRFDQGLDCLQTSRNYFTLLICDNFAYCDFSPKKFPQNIWYVLHPMHPFKSVFLGHIAREFVFLFIVFV